MTTRTKKLGEATISSPGGDVLLFECPVGRTAIIKDVRGRRDGGTGVSVVYIVGDNTTSIVLLALVSALGEVQTDPHNPWVVLEPGDQVRFFTQDTAAPAQAWVSGTLLHGEPA